MLMAVVFLPDEFSASHFAEPKPTHLKWEVLLPWY